MKSYIWFYSVTDHYLMGIFRIVMFCSIGSNCEFDPRSDQAIEYKIGICHFSANHAVLRRRAKTGWFSQNIGVIRILVIMSVSTLISANILYVFAKYRYCKFGNVFVFFFIWLQDHSQQFDAKLLQLSSV
jgi:hypothetical protein